MSKFPSILSHRKPIIPGKKWSQYVTHSLFKINLNREENVCNFFKWKNLFRNGTHVYFVKCEMLTKSGNSVDKYQVSTVNIIPTGKHGLTLKVGAITKHEDFDCAMKLQENSSLWMYRWWIDYESDPQLPKITVTPLVSPSPLIPLMNQPISLARFKISSCGSLGPSVCRLHPREAILVDKSFQSIVVSECDRFALILITHNVRTLWDYIATRNFAIQSSNGCTHSGTWDHWIKICVTKR